MSESRDNRKDEFISDMRSLLRRAGEKILEYYGGSYQIELKEQNSPLTEADLASEKILFDFLKAEYPDYSIVSEETIGNSGDKSITKAFIIDPLDGTKDFIDQTGEFSIILAVYEDGQITYGFVYQPTEKRFFFAIKNEGAFMEDGQGLTRLAVSEKAEQLKLMLSQHHVRSTELRLAKDDLVQETKRLGGAGLKLAEVARGAAEVYINSSSRTGEWDIAAGKLLVEEAGGRVTDLYGDELRFNQKSPYNKKGYVASNGVVHDQVVKQTMKILNSEKQNE